MTSFKLVLTTSNMSRHIATGWPNARNMLRSTNMLQYVAFSCCDRLAGASNKAQRESAVAIFTLRRKRQKGAIGENTAEYFRPFLEVEVGYDQSSLFSSDSYLSSPFLKQSLSI